MTNYISLDRSKTPKYYILPLFVVKKLCRSSNGLIYDKSAPQNIYTHNRSSDLWHIDDSWIASFE